MASRIFGSLALLLLLLCFSASAQVVQFSLTKASDGIASDQFGWSVATFGSILAVGAPWTDFNSTVTETGSVYLHSCSSFPCANFAKVSLPEPNTFARFGFSVALSDTLLVAGSRGAKISTFSNAGAAYLYSYSSSSSSATLLTKLNASTPAASEYFGTSAAISGSLVAIGAINDGSTAQLGSISLYSCSSIPCTLVTKITNSTSKMLGWSVAMEGNLLVAGAYATKVGANTSQGAAYLYDCSSASCTPGAILTASDGKASDQFGYSVAIRGQLVIVGAITATGVATNRGAAYVFRCSSPSSCTQIAKLSAPDGVSNDYFGVSVATKDFLVSVGARNHDVSGKSGAGSAYLFDCFGFSCRYVTRLSASDPSDSEYLGISSGFVDWKVSVGAYMGKVSGVATGFVKHFDPTATICNCSSSNSLSSSCGSDRQCACAQGWTGPQCTADVDECSLGLHNCHPHATCSNTLGSFVCSCTVGYLGDGISCVDDDECAMGTHNCNLHATCSNAPGSFVCSCNQGYSGDGVSCQDADECVLGTHTCDQNAICTNTIGSFGCTCASGYYGNGFSCQPIPTCSHNGIFMDGVCSCYSGFSGSDCSIDSSSSCSPLPTIPPMETQEIAEFMTSQSSISSNTFSFVIQSPATSRRYFSSISLNKVANCSYPGNPTRFSKTFLSSPNCKDIFTGSFSIPEVIHDCGFTQTAQPGFQVLSGKIHVTSKDYIGTVMSNTITRTTSSALALKLKLPTFINLTTSDLVISSSSIFNMFGVTRQEYDSQTDTATIEISTSVRWPHQLSLPGLAESPNPAFSYSIQIADTVCSQSASGSECLQITTLTISNIQGSSACFFSGSYSIDWTYGCRSGQSPCPFSGTDISSLNFTLLSDNICAEVEIEAALSGSMKSFSDNTFSTERVVSEANERMFFKASLTSDVTIQAISVRELRVVQSTGTQIIAQNGVVVAPFLTSLGFQWNDGSSSYNEIGFSFYAKTGKAPSDLFDSSKIKSVSSFTVEADLDIAYRTTFGRKRDVATSSFSLSALGVLDASQI